MPVMEAVKSSIISTGNMSSFARNRTNGEPRTGSCLQTDAAVPVNVRFPDRGFHCVRYLEARLHHDLMLSLLRRSDMRAVLSVQLDNRMETSQL